MSEKNQSARAEFLLLGFQNLRVFSLALFVFFHTIYMLTVSGNLLIVVLVAKSPDLKSPMYFFLANLSLCDIMLTSSVVPNLLHVILNAGAIVSFHGCIAQIYFYSISGVTECLLLTVMSYDRYLAICQPLHYTAIMDFRLRLRLALFCWVFAYVTVLFVVFLVYNLRFCDHRTIDHYFCDIGPVLELACSEHSLLDLSILVMAIVLDQILFSFILFTYVSIFITISQISTRSGKWKSFSTCSSHLIVVSTYYGTLITIYMVPSKGQSHNVNKVISLLYTLGTPFCNPIIYSLRNQEIKKAVKYLYNVAKR